MTDREELEDKMTKPNYAKEFEKQLGNPIEQVNKLIKQAHFLNQKYPVIKQSGQKPEKPHLMKLESIIIG